LQWGGGGSHHLSKGKGDASTGPCEEVASYYEPSLASNQAPTQLLAHPPAAARGRKSEEQKQENLWNKIKTV